MKIRVKIIKQKANVQYRKIDEVNYFTLERLTKLINLQ